MTRARVEAVETRHRIIIGGREITLGLRRSARRRSFALQVDHRGPRVSVPLGASPGQIDGFVRQHGQWLLERIEARGRNPSPPPLALEDGALFPLFGQTARLRFGRPPGAQGRAACWRVAEDGVEELWLPGAQAGMRGFIRALQARALAWHRGRVDEFCFRLGRAAPAVRLSHARTRWGSCSRISGIRLHWRLIHLELALIDYVAAHEVAHLAEMNHSPRFWAVVGSLCPAWREARARLRLAAASLPDLDPSHPTATGEN